MNTSFPFYTPVFDFSGSIFYEVFRRFIVERFSVSIDQLARHDYTELLLLACQADNKTCSAAEILKYFFEETRQRLNADESKKIASIIKLILEAITGDESGYEYHGLILAFNEIKRAVLIGQEPDEKSTQFLAESIFGEDEKNILKIVHLFYYFDLDIEKIVQYFSNIDTSEISSSVKIMLHTIGTTGIRATTDYIVRCNDEKYDESFIKSLRSYCELFCMFINLLNDISGDCSQKNECYMILALMKAAYYDGQIVREMSFYSEDSLKTMGSIGTSVAMRERSDKKDILYADAKKAIEDKYSYGSLLHPEDMANEILKEKRFESLGMIRVINTAKEVVKENDLRKKLNKKRKK